MSRRVSWEGVFPAVTTQFHHDLSLDIDATAKVMDGLIRDGVSGLIVCGSVGENTSLERKEKVAIMETAKSVAAGRVPVLCGIAEFTTAFAVETAVPYRQNATRSVLTGELPVLCHPVGVGTAVGRREARRRVDVDAGEVAALL